jgi:hypothetical protein
MSKVFRVFRIFAALRECLVSFLTALSQPLLTDSITVMLLNLRLIAVDRPWDWPLYISSNNRTVYHITLRPQK